MGWRQRRMGKDADSRPRSDRTTMIDPIVPPVGHVDAVSPFSSAPPVAPAQPSSGVAAPIEATTLDTVPSSPPAEVMDAVSAAHGVHDDLAAAGRQVSFHVGDDGRVTLRIDDLDGNPQSAHLPAGRVFDILDGEPVA